jgi:branched-chain amino acid transport system permease protein
MFNSVLPLAVDALASAALVFFVSVGLTLVFSVLRILNVAHGSFYSIGAYLAASSGLWIAASGVNPWLSYPALLLSAAIAAALLGPTLERSLVRWTYGRGEAVQILVTFGLFLILEDSQRIIFGVQSLYEDTPMTLLGVTQIGDVVYLNYQFLLIALAVAVLATLRIMIRHTRTGRLLAAVVADREISAAMGINTGRMFMLAFSIGIFLAALGGALAAPTTGVAPGLGAETMVLAFAVAAIGGLGQIEGAAVASTIVATAKVLAVYFLPAVDSVAPYLVMLAVLMVRPQGLFGIPKTRRI